MAKKKSSFYHVRWNKVGLNEARAAEVLGVSVDQIIEWDNGGAPIHAERCLLLWDQKRINLDGWDGFMFSRGVLKYKNKQQWRPENLILGMTPEAYEITVLQKKIAALYSIDGLIKISRTITANKTKKIIFNICKPLIQ